MSATDHPHLGEAVPAPAAKRFGRSSSFATLMLLAVTLLWGTSFTLSKTWQDAVAAAPLGDPGVVRVLTASLTLILLRTLPATLLLAAVAPGMVTRPARRAHFLGGQIGAVFFVGFALQMTGLAFISPAKSGFLVSLGSVWVPLAAWLAGGRRLPTLVWLGFAAALSGVLLLDGFDPAGFGVGWGEGLTLIGTFFYAGQVLLVDRNARFVPSEHFTFGFLSATALLAAAGLTVVVCAGPGVAAWWRWTVGLLAGLPVASAVAALVVVTVLSFHWMGVYQPRVGAARASVIYLSESIFCAAIAVAAGYDELTWVLIVSGGLIVLGNFLAEAGQARRPAGTRPA